MVKTSEGKIYDMASINARNIPQKEVVPLITLDDVKLDLESGAGKVNILKGINLKICAGCREPISSSEIKSNKYEEGVTCPNCFSLLSDDQKKRFN